MALETLRSHPARFTAVDLALVGVAFAWGTNASVLKGALTGWDPLAFNALRFGAAALLTFTYMWVTDPDWVLSRADLGRVALLGLIGNGLYQWLFIEAIHRSTASNTMLFLGLSPLVVTLWSAGAGLERMTAWVLGGAAISLSGVALVLLGQEGGLRFSAASVTGDLFGFAAMLCWAAYTVLARPIIARVGSSLRVTAWAMLFGASTNLLISFSSLRTQNFATAPGISWIGMGYSALVALVFGYLAYTWGVKQLGSARASVYINLVPIIAAAVAWVMLGETWTAWQWAGALLVILGVTAAKMESARP